MKKKSSKTLVARGRRKLQQVAVFFRKLWRIKKVRVACFVLVGLIVLVEVIPLAVRSLQAANYDLGAIKNLVDPTSKDLRQKLDFDDAKRAWVFNRNAADQVPGQSGDGIKVGGVTYSAELPMRMSKTSGLKMTDVAAQIDMTMTPQFNLGEGRVQEGYAVYPIRGSDAQLVYTFKQDGVKEDIILHRAPGDKISFSYTLDLPDSLEARLQDDGSVGIFGGARSLFGNISYGSDKDRELVEKARKNSKKTELYYAIPAPVIEGDEGGSAKAQFKLDGDTLTVNVNGLKDAHYPLSIDPSFVMDTTTNCSWRKSGNNEGNTNYSSCQLSRSALSGGTVGSWTTNTNNLASADHNVKVIAYNGKLYTYIGNALYYASIDPSTGVVGSSVATTHQTGDANASGAAIIVNGYIYMVGGNNTSNKVFYAKIDSTTGNTAAAWQSGPNLNVGRGTTAIAAYNGRIYTTGGCSNLLITCQAVTAVTEHATVRGDGSLSAWTQSTSAATGNLPVALWHNNLTAHNGWLYSVGGQIGNTGLNGTSAVYRVAIKSDGSIGTWVTDSVALPTTLYGSGVTISNGYLYVVGGWASDSAVSAIVYIAKVYADGSIGPFRQTTSITTARTYITAATYNGKVYFGGGCSNAAYGSCTTYQDIQYSTINTVVGDVSPFTTETDTIPTTNGGIHSAATVIYGGYMYILGGRDKDTQTNAVRYAKLNPDGSTGAWGTTSAFTDARMEPSATAYNGYMYIAGGHRTGATTACPDLGLGAELCTDIQYAQINSNGTLGAWASAGGPYAGAGNTGRTSMGMVTYNGYVYLMGGNYNNNSSVSPEVDTAPINADGTVGTWTQNASGLGTTGRALFGIAQAGPYVYIAGGRKDPGGYDNADVIYATLSSGGGMSAWASAGPNFANGRTPVFLSESNGYLYIAGGASNGAIKDVQYIKINTATGALSGSWTTSAVQFGTRRINHQGGIYNGYLYLAGGCQSMTLEVCNTAINQIEYAQIYNGGGGSDGTWVAGPTSSTITRYAPMTVASSGYLIVMGGCTTILVGNCSAIASSSTYAAINPDGSLGSWTTGTPMPQSLHSAGVTSANGYVYLAGGCSSGGCSSVQNTVYSALICTGNNNGVDGCGATGGTLGTWHTLNTISARWGTAAVAANGYLYVAGGVNGSGTNLNDVQSAQLLPTGGLGGWGAAGSGATFTTARAGHGLVSYGDYLYILGGTTGSANLSDVQMAQVQSSGQLGAWNSTTGMPATSFYGLAAAANGYVYYSGTRGSTLTNQTMYAPIMSNGTLGRWTSTSGNSDTTALSGFAGALYNGYLYRAGGFDLGTAISNTSYYAPLQATPQIARHSMLLTTDARTLPANFFATSTPQNIGSTIKITPWTANDSGGSPANVTLTSLGERSSMTNGVKYSLTPGNDGTKYYWLQFVLDDTQTYTWGETANPSTFSYFQLNYHPNPGKRLRGGKTFNQNVIQSLDAR